MKGFFILIFFLGCASNPMQLHKPVLEKKSGEIAVSVFLRHYSHARLYFQSMEEIDICSDTGISIKPDSVSIVWYFGNIKIDRIDRCYLSKDTSLFHDDTANQFPNIHERGCPQ